jgi:hypothetical protein
MNRIVLVLAAIFVFNAYHLSAKENIYIKAVIDSLNEETSIDYIDVFHNDSLIFTIDSERFVNKYDLLSFYNYDPDRDIELIYPDDSYYFVDNNTLYIYQTEISSRLVVRLFDIRGNKIWEKYGFTRTGYNELDLETHRLHKGAYFLMFTNGCNRISVPFLITEDNVYNIPKDTIVTPPIIDEFENNYKFIAHKGIQNPDTLEFNREEIISLDSLIFNFKTHNYYYFPTGKLIIEDVKVIVEEDDNGEKIIDTTFFNYEQLLRKDNNFYNCQEFYDAKDTIRFCSVIPSYFNFANELTSIMIINDISKKITNFVFEYNFYESGSAQGVWVDRRKTKTLCIDELFFEYDEDKKIYVGHLSNPEFLKEFYFFDETDIMARKPNTHDSYESSKTTLFEFIPGTSQIRIELYPE